MLINMTLLTLKGKKTKYLGLRQYHLPSNHFCIDYVKIINTNIIEFRLIIKDLADHLELAARSGILLKTMSFSGFLFYHVNKIVIIIFSFTIKFFLFSTTVLLTNFFYSKRFQIFFIYFSISILS